tara:strand:- start:126 stop:359 length:234 start_codon:yes stop_codon:yes gene_type:complete
MKTQEEIEQQVEYWNWNMNIFEIYDEIRDQDNYDNARTLSYAYQFFNQDRMIAELADHLCIDISEAKEGARLIAKVK